MIFHADENNKDRIVIYGPRRDKTCLRGFVNNKAAEQPAHPHSLISAFVISKLKSIIYQLASSEISTILIFFIPAKISAIPKHVDLSKVVRTIHLFNPRFAVEIVNGLVTGQYPEVRMDLYQYYIFLYTKTSVSSIQLEDLKVLRRSPDIFNNAKLGQGQLQLIMEQILFYHIWRLQPFWSSDLNNLMNNPSNGRVISEKKMFR